MKTRSVATRDQGLLRAWYEGRWWLYGLLPLSYLFQFISRLRRRLLQSKQQAPSIPVIVVGNITLGGTGKTPLLISLAKHLRERGFKPGIISRGHGSLAPHYPYTVQASESAQATGDEPLLIAQNTGCPVVIDADRNRALAELIEHHDCDLVLSDDGLQHYKLARSIELVVIDGQRGLGNGFCLPAGPLREPESRLSEVDWVLVNGRSAPRLSERLNNTSLRHDVVTMNLEPGSFRRLEGDDAAALGATSALDVTAKAHAIAGIGNPARFFATLDSLGLSYDAQVFSDHHDYQLAEINFADDRPVVMTEKDAVKIRALLSELDVKKRDRYWYLPVTAQLPGDFIDQLVEQIRRHPLHSSAMNSSFTSSPS